MIRLTEFIMLGRSFDYEEIYRDDKRRITKRT